MLGRGTGVRSEGGLSRSVDRQVGAFGSMPSPSGASLTNGANPAGSRGTAAPGARPEEGGSERGLATAGTGMYNGQRRGVAGSSGKGPAQKQGLKRLAIPKPAREQEPEEVLNEGIAVYCDDGAGKRTHATLRVRCLPAWSPSRCPFCLLRGPELLVLRE